MKKLVVVVACLCAVSGAWASEKKEEKTEQQKTYRLKYDQAFIDVDDSIIVLMHALKDFLDEWDEESAATEDGKLVVDVKSFLQGGKMVFTDFKELVKLAHNELDLTLVPSKKLIDLIKAANYLGADNATRNLLQELCKQLAENVADTTDFELISEIATLPNDVLNYELPQHRVFDFLKEPKKVCEGTTYYFTNSDREILIPAMPNGFCVKIMPDKNSEKINFIIKNPSNDKILWSFEDDSLSKQPLNDYQAIVLLSGERCAIIARKKMQIFDLKAKKVIRSIDAPQKCFFEYPALALADDTFVCRLWSDKDDEHPDLFVWHLKDWQSTRLQLSKRKEFSHTPAYKISKEDREIGVRFTTIVHDIVSMVIVSQDEVAVCLDNNRIQIWNIKTETMINRGGTHIGSYCDIKKNSALVLLPDGSLGWVDNTERALVKWEFRTKKQPETVMKLNNEDFVDHIIIGPKKSFAVFTGKGVLKIYDLVNKKQMTEVPLKDKKLENWNYYLRKKVKYIGNGRLMLDLKDDIVQVWQMTDSQEDLSFEQFLFYKAFMRTPQKPVKKIEKQPLPTKQEEKEGFFKRLKKSLFNVVPESIKETEGEEPSGLGMNIEETNFERISGDGVMAKAFALCLDQNTEKNTEFLKQLKITEQEAKVLLVLPSLNKLLDESVTTSEQVRAGMVEVTKLLKGIKFDELPGYVRRELTEKKRKAEEKELTLKMHESYTKKHEEEEGK
jgi:hypothetical protein